MSAADEARRLADALREAHLDGVQSAQALPSAAAMLEAQADEIERLQAERDALRADAERGRCAVPVPDEWLVKVRRLVQGFEHVSGLARLWEPDYSTGSERALWSRATEACADVAKLLNETKKAADAPQSSGVPLTAQVAAERERINALLVEIRAHWVKTCGADSISVGALDVIAELIADGSYVKRAHGITGEGGND